MKRTICTRNKTFCRLAAKMKDLEDGGEAAEGSDEEGGEVGCNWIEKHWWGIFGSGLPCQGKGTQFKLAPAYSKMHGDGEDLNMVTSVNSHHRWTVVWCVDSTGGSSRCCCPLSPVCSMHFQGGIVLFSKNIIILVIEGGHRKGTAPLSQPWFQHTQGRKFLWENWLTCLIPDIWKILPGG